MAEIPTIGSILRDENDECALVVEPGTDPLDALLWLVQEEYGGEELFARDNPAILKAAEGLRIESWRSYGPALAEAEGIDLESYNTGWWGPSGDGAEVIHVLPYPGSAYFLGELAEEAERAGASPGSPQQ